MGILGRLENNKIIKEMHYNHLQPRIFFVGPCGDRTPDHLIKRKRAGSNDFNNLQRKLALPVITVNTINSIYLLKSCTFKG